MTQNLPQHLKPLSLIGGHELQPLDDATLLEWNPQVYVIARTAEHSDAINKALARVHHVKALLPNTKIGVRWIPDDKQSSPGSPNYRTPEEYAETYFKLHVDGTLLMPDNEPAADEKDPRVYAQTIDWQTRLVRIANPVGVELGMHGLSTGNPDYPQYHLIKQLLAAMEEGALLPKPVVHWLRPNAYVQPPPDPVNNPLSEHYHHAERHQREIRKAATLAPRQLMPPMMLGEFAPIKTVHDAEAGWLLFMSGAAAAWEVIRLTSLDEDPKIPRAFYAIGAGIYDEKWKWFNALADRSFFSVVIHSSPRVLPDQNVRLEQAYIQAVRSKANVTWQTFDWGEFIPTAVVEINEPINLRDIPSARTPAKVVGTLTAGMVVGFYRNRLLATDSRNPDNRYHWNRLRVAGIGDCYAAQIQALKFKPLLSSGLSEETQAQIVAHLSDIRASASTVETLIKGATPPSSGGGF